MNVESGRFQVPLACRYLFRPPQPGVDPLLFVVLHGYGSNPETMLRLSLPLIGEQHAIVSVQAPFQHYTGQPGSGAEIGFNWGVTAFHADAVQLHHSMLLTLLGELDQLLGIPRSRTLLMGFSQPVGLNYRFIGTYPGEVGGIVGLCGGVPRDWEEGKYLPVSAPILHISRDADEFFPAQTAAGFPDRLKVHASDVEFHMLPGGHRFPSKAGAIVHTWLKRVFPGTLQ